ncbi:hypothetical protein DFH07DRAFT_783638 [Mycena maculata]|uniref:Uncharacterized protein n=1 Tax=Mycena maculata TaxID=230809 RepID=A0AAD7MLL4_9AGAR|nr:hypothetical protein DFH07DRAFT_783638 [Mycena maculata]
MDEKKRAAAPSTPSPRRSACKGVDTHAASSTHEQANSRGCQAWGPVIGVDPVKWDAQQKSLENYFRLFERLNGEKIAASVWIEEIVEERVEIQLRNALSFGGSGYVHGRLGGKEIVSRRNFAVDSESLGVEVQPRATKISTEFQESVKPSFQSKPEHSNLVHVRPWRAVFLLALAPNLGADWEDIVSYVNVPTHFTPMIPTASGLRRPAFLRWASGLSNLVMADESRIGAQVSAMQPAKSVINSSIPYFNFQICCYRCRVSRRYVVGAITDLSF